MIGRGAPRGVDLLSESEISEEDLNMEESFWGDPAPTRQVSCGGDAHNTNPTTAATAVRQMSADEAVRSPGGLSFLESDEKSNTIIVCLLLFVIFFFL